MFVVRALFWLAVVSLFVPYKVFDPVKGEFAVDYPALRARIASIVHPCENNPRVCEAAGRLAQLAAAEAGRFAENLIQSAARDGRNGDAEG